MAFRDEAGQVHVVGGVCPHRAAPLGKGWLGEAGGKVCVMCPYHGWAFDGEGKLRDVPAETVGAGFRCLRRGWAWTATAVVSSHPGCGVVGQSSCIWRSDYGTAGVEAGVYFCITNVEVGSRPKISKRHCCCVQCLLP